MSAPVIGRGVKVTFYGHAAFKVAGPEAVVVIDPWLSNPVLQTSVSQVGPVDVILVTHGHGDHVGGNRAVGPGHRGAGGGHS
jgi:L-ascorbate metabolism protein UlaG (beta-lactamase superfamily)